MLSSEISIFCYEMAKMHRPAHLYGCVASIEASILRTLLVKKHLLARHTRQMVTCQIKVARWITIHFKSVRAILNLHVMTIQIEKIIGRSG